jgi:hypothetical protein
VNDCLVWVPKKLLVTRDRWDFFGEQPFSIFGIFFMVFSLQAVQKFLYSWSFSHPYFSMFFSSRQQHCVP